MHLFTLAICFGVGNWQPPGSHSAPNSPTLLPSLQFLPTSLFFQILFSLPFPFPFPSPRCASFVSTLFKSPYLYQVDSAFLSHNINESDMRLFSLHLPLRFYIIRPVLANLSVSSSHH